MFGEAQSRVVVSIDSSLQSQFEQKMANSGVHFTQLGKVTLENISIDGESWGNMEDWKNQYDTAIEKLLING